MNATDVTTNMTVCTSCTTGYKNDTAGN